MQINLVRSIYTANSTCGTLTTPSGSFYTLELPRGDGSHGFCISPGTYQVNINYSPDFKQNMPILLNVPGRSEIRIHWGNYPHDSLGCILIGESQSTDFVGSSREAFSKFFPQLQAAVVNNEISSIKITEL
jgi:Family of unknown function (DUF5675)